MFVLDPFIEGVSVSYAVDEGTHFRFVSNKDLSDTLTVEMLRAAALENLAVETKERTDFKGDLAQGVMIVNGGDYEVTMLLLDSFGIL